MKKKVWTLLLLAMILALTGCGTEKEKPETMYETSTSTDYMGLDVTIRQDKNEYTKDDQIRLTVDLVNDSGLYLSNLVIKSDFSNALMIIDGDKKIEVDPMNEGERQNLSIVLAKAPLYKRALNMLEDGLEAVGNRLWQFIKTHIVFDLIVLGCILLTIMTLVIIRKVQDAKLKKQGVDPKVYRAQKRKEKRLAKKEQRRQKRQEKKLQRKAARHAKRELKKGVAAKARDEAKKLIILLICGAMLAESGLGGIAAGASGILPGSDKERIYSSEDYSMEVSHSFYVEGREYTYTATISFTLTLIMTEGDTLNDPFTEKIENVLWPTEQNTEYSWSGAVIPAVSVSCETENGAGELLISDCSGESYLMKTAGLVGNPVDITLQGDNLKEAVITFAYNPDKLGDIDENKLGIVWYDEANDIMVLMENSRVDAEANTVSLRTDHFSKYAVVDTESWYESWRKAQFVSRGGTADFPEFFNIVVAVDCSGSMQGENNEMSKSAAYKFITELEDNDMFTVLKFDDEAATVVPATYNGDCDINVYEAIYGIKTNGGTSFNNGLMACISALNAMDTTRKYNPYYAGTSYVNGTITDENGNPLEGVTVSFSVKTEERDQSLSSIIDPIIDHQIVTDESGTFSIECSSSCYLSISYEKEGYQKITKNITTSREKTVDASTALYPNGYIGRPSYGGGIVNNGLYSVEKLVVFLSDGQSSVSQDTYNALAACGCKVITIGLGQGASGSTLQSIANATGGVYIHTNNPSELENVYEIIWGTYIGVSPEDTDGDGIPDAVEKAGMKNQYGEMIGPNPDYADTDGDGYSDSAEMGYYNDATGVFEMVSDPTVPSKYVSDAKLRFSSSGNVKLVASSDINRVMEEKGKTFTINIGVSALKLVYPTATLPDGTTITDYLSETVYTDPTGTEMWATWSDDCLSASITRFSGLGVKAGGSGVGKTFTFICSKGGVTCKNDHVIEIHAKASNSDEVVVKIQAQDKVRQQWITRTKTWMTEAENDLRADGTELIEQYVDRVESGLNGEQKVRDQIQFTAAPGNDELANAVKEWMENDYLKYVDEKYEATLIKTEYDTGSAANLVKSIAKKIDGTNTTVQISANGRAYTFKVSRTSAYGVVQWMFTGAGGAYYGVTKNLDEAVAQYLNDLKTLGDSQIEELKDELSALSFATDTLDLVVLDTLFDTLSKKDCIALLKQFGLSEKFYDIRTLFKYYDDAGKAFIKCVNDPTKLEEDDIIDLAETIAKYLTSLYK